MNQHYVYIMSETAAETGDHPLYTVGFYDPDGKWRAESDCGGEEGKEEAAGRVAWLNGGGLDKEAEADAAEAEPMYFNFSSQSRGYFSVPIYMSESEENVLRSVQAEVPDAVLNSCKARNSFLVSDPRIFDMRPLVSFLYDLMRDHLVPGKVERLVIDAEACAGKKIIFSNGALAKYAQQLAKRMGAEAPPHPLKL